MSEHHDTHSNFTSVSHLHPNQTGVRHSKQKKRGKALLLSSILIMLTLLFLGGLVSLGVAAYFFIFKDLPSPYALKDFKVIPISSQIYDRNGTLLYEIYSDENRNPISIDQVPETVKQATIAIEDKDFYSHKGISLVGGILRAARDTYLTDNLQGGSTLTQQLVKSALLSPERTIQRKLKEIILAIWTERIFTKDQILEMYLNQVPYGGSSYGIENASRTFFDKSATELTLAEAALLAGLPQAPSLYSPYSNPDLAERRRNEVLQRMVEEGYITEEQRQQAAAEQVTVLPLKVDIKAPHFVFYIKKVLEEEFGTEVVEEGGLRVTTTLDLDIQASAEAIVNEELESLSGYNVGNGAALVTRPPTGEILAMVGSRDYFATPSGAFNVTTAARQPGSSIKPVNYAIGIDRGIVTASSIFLDTKTCFNADGQPESYCPKNYDNTFRGPVGLRYALANSYNIPAVKMMAYNGVDTFIASAPAFLITSLKDPSQYGLSLTLGGGEIPMIEMSQAYSAFANRGRPKKLIGILKIQDKTGNTIASFTDPNFVQDVKKPIKSPNYLAMRGERAISEGAAFIISHILQDNQARQTAFGPSSELVVPDKSVSVKTGTTDNIKDNWTIGYTPNFLVAVWVGNNDNTPMNPYLTSGITGAAPIWNGIISAVLENQPDIPPVKPSSVIGTQVCRDTGVAASVRPGCGTRFEYLIRGTEAVSTITFGNAKVPVYKGTDIEAPADDPNIEYKEKAVIRDVFVDGAGRPVCFDCKKTTEE